MPDIKSLVKKLIADGESEDVIKAVIKKMDAAEDGSDIKSGLPDMSPELPAKDEYKGPDTFAGGFKKSLLQKAPGSQFSEAMQAGGKGFVGNMKSILDIPANLAHGAKDLLDFHLNPGQTSLRMFESLKQIPDIVKNAGNDPETFGRTLGAFTTAPLVTEGLGAAALRGPGAINRIPRVNKTLSAVGSTLEGTRNSSVVPTTPRGLVAGAVRGAVRPIGRVLSRAGERGRLAGSKVENLQDAAKRTTPNPPPNEKVYAGGGQGATRNRPVRHDTPDTTRPDLNSAFTRPILEDANTRAGRSAFSRPGANVSKDIYPLDSNPPILEGLTERSARPPEIDLTQPVTPPINVGEGGLSSRYRHRPYEPGQQADAIVENAGKPKAAPTESSFEPSVDPAKNFSFEDLQMMKSRRDEVNAILHKMAEENVDPTTGEILPPQTTFPGIEPQKRARNWNITRDEGVKFADNVNEEMNYFGGEQPSGMIDDAGIPETTRRFPGDEAFDLGEISPGFRQTSSMPDWGSPEVLNPPDLTSPVGRLNNEQLTRLSKLSPAEGGTGERGNAAQIELMRRGVGEGAPHVNDPTFYDANHGDVIDYNFKDGTRNVTKLEPGPVNPLRPEVPEGQVTNRRMFELSEQRAAEMRAAEARQFDDSIAPHEFSEDMMFTPEELRPTEVPPMRSPVENQFDPRTSNIDQIPEGVGGDLHPDTNIDHASYLDSLSWQKEHNTPGVRPADLSEFVRQVTGKKVDVIGPTGESLSRGLRPDIDVPRTIQPEEWGDWGGLEADIPTLVPDASGSHVAAPDSMVHQPKPRMPDEVLPPAEFEPGDFNNPNWGRYDAHPNQIEKSRFNNPAYRAEMRQNWGDLTQSEIQRHIELQSVMNGPLEQITPQLHQEYTALNNRRPGPKQPDQYLMKQAAEQRRLENIKQRQLPESQFSAKANEEAGFFGPDKTPETANDSGGPWRRPDPAQKGKVRKRLEELYDKDRNGKLTAADLAEAQRLTKHLNSLDARWNNAENIFPEDVAAYHKARTDNNTQLRKEGYDVDMEGKVTRKSPSEIAARTELENSVGGKRNLDQIELDNLLEDGRNLQEQFGNTSRVHEETSQFSKAANEEAGSFNVDDDFGIANDSPRLIKEDGSRVKPVGTKGEAFRVTGPDGKHLGDISITEKQIAEIQKHPNYSDMPREEVVKAIHEARLETILEEHGIAEDAMSRVKVEPLDGRTKRADPVESKKPQPKLPPPFSESSDVGNYGAESLTDFSGTTGPPVKSKPSVFKTSTKVTIDPDVDFGPGGDIKPIVQEVARLDSDKAVDTKYRSLLPKIMRSELGPGETYRGKLDRLITEIQGELNPEAGAQRLAEMDAFLESTRNATGAEALPDVPLLPKFSKIDRGKLQPGKLDKRPEPWVSPRLQQQFPDLARRLKTQNKK